MKINKYKKISVVLLMAVTMSGCNSFLEFDPYGLEGSINFWKTEGDVEKALNAFHEFTYKEGVTGRGFMWYENCSDNLVTGRSSAPADQIKNFQMSASNDRDAKDTWPYMFQLNAKANDVLRNVPEMLIPEAVKNNAIGQGHFYRAFAYLWVAPFYGDNGPNGGIPIVTEKTLTQDLDQPRPASVLANYDLIISDMRTAGELLPYLSELADKDYGRPHKAAAWAFGARAALYAAQYDPKYYDMVIEFCDKIMALSGADKRGLFPDFTKLFRRENNFSEEYLFSLLGNATEGPKFHGMSFQNKGWGLYNTWGYFQPTLELYKAYADGDKRRTATILFPNEHITFVGRDVTYGVGTWSSASSSGMTFRKFMSPWEGEHCATDGSVNGNSDSPSNVLGMTLIRYADVVLMKAEALIWSKGEGDGEAKSLLNLIRRRAGLPEDSQATKAQLKNERRCELAFEFQPSRHIDLVRWGDAQAAYAQPLHGVETVLKSDGTFDHVTEMEIWSARTFNPRVNHVFPIPSTEVARSKNLTQNLGY